MLVTYRTSPAAAETTMAELQAIGVEVCAFRWISSMPRRPETWDAILADNLRAPFLVSQRLGLGMNAGGGGHIVNIGDWGDASLSFLFALPRLQAGLIHMTRVLALEPAPEVQVNCVCPGPALLPEGYDAASSRWWADD